MTTKMRSWKRGNVLVFREGIEPAEGVVLGNVAIVGWGRAPHRRYLAAHQPSGLRLWDHAPRLADAKAMTARILDEFGPDLLDRIAADDKGPDDDNRARELVDLIREWRYK